MQEKLVIYLHPEDLSRPSWAVVTVDGVVRQHAVHDAPEGLAALAVDKEVSVLVPSADVLLVSTTLPKMNRSRLLQALPFAVEEQLIEDVALLHFAVGEQRADGHVSAAVVSNEKMQSWLALLASWQIAPDVMIPAIFALPVEENTWHAVVNGMAVVRMSETQGFGCDTNNLIEMLSLAFSTETVLPASIKVKVYGEGALGDVSSLPVPVNLVRSSIQDLIAELAVRVLSVAPINLLQGQFVVKKTKFPRMDKLWKAASYLAVAWVVLLLLYPLGSYVILKHRLSGLDQQIAEIYKRNFPQSTSVIAPKMRLEEKLQKLMSQMGGSRLLVLLGDVGKAMEVSGSVKLKQFDFQSGQLTLTLTAANADDFSSFTDFLTQKGVQVKQQSATLAGERINAVVQVN